MTSLRLTPLAFALGASTCMLSANVAAQSAFSYDFYGSLRTQFEAVSPDRQDRLNSYTSVRDAFSRVGFKGEYQFNKGLALTGQLEIPIDSANLRVRDPFDQGDAARPHGQQLRIAQLGLRSDFGTLTYGQQWMPYYNAVAAPVDMFSSYYSGYATYTATRIAETISYSSPEFKGFSLALSHSGSGGNHRSTSRIDDRRQQVAATYTFDNTRIAAGMDDRGNAGYGRNRIYGLSASHKAGNLYVAAKYEVFDTQNFQPGRYSTDGNEAINLFGSYALGKNTFKLMLAKVKNYGENIIHVGVDHQVSDALKVFVEYYRESETAALTPRRGGMNDFDAGISGGRAVAVGFRYDF